MCIRDSVNTALGADTLTGITSGNHNNAIGYQAGTYATSITTGTKNIFIGAYTRANSSSASNGICIGYDLEVSENMFGFGKAGNKVHNTFTSNASWTRSSDERKKTNIADATLGLDFINDLSTKTFKWKRSQDIPNTFDDYRADENLMDTDVTMHGMLAQDVKAALDTAGVSDFAGWVEESDGSQSLSQEMFVFPLIKAIQELSAKNEALLTRIEALEG